MHGTGNDYREILTPSYHGELCRHNGENPDYEIACDECDYYLYVFPTGKQHLPGSMLKAPRNRWPVFLRAALLSKIDYCNPPPLCVFQKRPAVAVVADVADNAVR